jgi:hypothetical protein
VVDYAVHSLNEEAPDALLSAAEEVMHGMADRRATAVIAYIFFYLALAFLMTACAADDDRQPNPHSHGLALKAASPVPKAAESITITEASKKSYSFRITYPYNSPQTTMANDATDLIRALLRKLVEDGQKPHDQETEISVWALAIKPGKIGESGHQFDSSERYFIWASYYPPSDSIQYEECTEDSTQWRSGHCS